VVALAILVGAAVLWIGDASLRIVGWTGGAPRIHGGPPPAPDLVIGAGMGIDAAPAGPVVLGLGDARMDLEPGARMSGEPPALLAGGLDFSNLDGHLRVGSIDLAGDAAAGRAEVAPWAAWVRLDQGSAQVSGLPLAAGRQVIRRPDGGRQEWSAPLSGSLDAAVAAAYARDRWWIHGPAPDPGPGWTPDPAHVIAAFAGPDAPTRAGAVLHLPAAGGEGRSLHWRLGPLAGGVHLRFTLGFRALGPMASYDIGTTGMEVPAGLGPVTVRPPARRLAGEEQSTVVDLRLLPVGRTATGAVICEQVFSDADGIRSQGLVELSMVELVVSYRFAHLTIQEVQASSLSHTPAGR
jgi:hypothetical protein